MLAPMDVLELGRMGIAVDPAGAVFGVWQAGAMVGAGIANEPGSLIWSENMTRDWRANQDFYAAVFGYVFEDMSAPGFDYATFSTSGDPLGAVGGLPAEVADSLAPAWFTYFAIDDADRAVDRAAALGGGIVRPPWDTPFGRLAVLSDPGGAEFSVMAVSIAEPEMVDGGD
jgi:predicted enzyme related to lactoylglutathione lyase